ncbi:hypothetical protein [Vibrio sp.]|uniref:hypothetical protein n=1 Tax=Vibrio sp. TaxID=678 RepID=UPI003AA8C7BE
MNVQGGDHYDKKEQKLEIRSCFLESENWLLRGLYFLTGDNPLLFDDLTQMFAFKSKFIMPLSNNQLITFSSIQNHAMNLDPLFTTYLAMATYNQCHRYVVGINKDYIEQIKLFLGSEVEPSNLRAELFTYI